MAELNGLKKGVASQPFHRHGSILHFHRREDKISDHEKRGPNAGNEVLVLRVATSIVRGDLWQH
jgi:hypothetical protein